MPEVHAGGPRPPQTLHRAQGGGAVKHLAHLALSSMGPSAKTGTGIALIQPKGLSPISLSHPLSPLQLLLGEAASFVSLYTGSPQALQ